MDKIKQEPGVVTQMARAVGNLLIMTTIVDLKAAPADTVAPLHHLNPANVTPETEKPQSSKLSSVGAPKEGAPHTPHGTNSMKHGGTKRKADNEASASAKKTKLSGTEFSLSRTATDKELLTCEMSALEELKKANASFKAARDDVKKKKMELQGSFDHELTVVEFYHQRLKKAEEEVKAAKEAAMKAFSKFNSLMHDRKDLPGPKPDHE